MHHFVSFIFALAMLRNFLIYSNVVNIDLVRLQIVTIKLRWQIYVKSRRLRKVEIVSKFVFFTIHRITGCSCEQIGLSFSLV